MPRRRRALRRPTPTVAHLIHTAAGSARDAERELAAGDCGEAVRSIAHAYQIIGEATGYVKALREMKGRTGSPQVIFDKRLPSLARIKIKIARACKVR